MACLTKSDKVFRRVIFCFTVGYDVMNIKAITESIKMLCVGHSAVDTRTISFSNSLRDFFPNGIASAPIVSPSPVVMLLASRAAAMGSISFLGGHSFCIDNWIRKWIRRIFFLVLAAMLSKTGAITKYARDVTRLTIVDLSAIWACDLYAGVASSGAKMLFRAGIAGALLCVLLAAMIAVESDIEAIWTINLSGIRHLYPTFSAYSLICLLGRGFCTELVCAFSTAGFRLGASWRIQLFEISSRNGPRLSAIFAGIGRGFHETLRLSIRGKCGHAPRSARLSGKPVSLPLAQLILSPIRTIDK